MSDAGLVEDLPPEEVVDAVDRALERSSGARAIPGNAVELLFDGPETYEAMHRLIREARHRIHFENYIINDDKCGQGFADALIARAREGVKVRLLYDWFGSSGTGRKFWNRLREGGVEVCAFGRPNLLKPMEFISRDHRKLLVVDGDRAVTGGLCIGDEWAGDAECGQQPWRDTAVLIEGPAARALDASFGTLWQRAGGSPVDDAREVGGSVPQRGQTAVRVVAVRPGAERTWRTLDLLFAMGGSRIWITEAYLAGPLRLYQVFEDAARDGVDVRLLVPGASDLPMIRNISRTGYKRLLRSGVRIWEWQGPMLHAKTVSVDERWVRVGSSNLNPSSLMVNWEVDVFVEDPVFARQLDQKFQTDIGRSAEVVLRPSRLVPPVPGFRGATTLATERPDLDPAITRHRRSVGERRRRMLQHAVGLSRAARLALLGPLVVGMVIMIGVLLTFPVIAAYVTAGILALILSGLLLRGLLRQPRD